MRGVILPLLDKSSWRSAPFKKAQGQFLNQRIWDARSMLHAL